MLSKPFQTINTRLLKVHQSEAHQITDSFCQRICFQEWSVMNYLKNITNCSFKNISLARTCRVRLLYRIVCHKNPESTNFATSQCWFCEFQASAVYVNFCTCSGIAEKYIWSEMKLIYVQLNYSFQKWYLKGFNSKFISGSCDSSIYKNFVFRVHRSRYYKKLCASS